MKYPAHIYAKALVEALADAAQAEGGERISEARIGEQFLALVRKNGDEAYLRKILDLASRGARERSGMRKIVIESAREFTAAQRGMVDGLVKKEDVVESKIDPSLIAGIRITVNDELQFDGSLKHKLNNVLGSR